MPRSVFILFISNYNHRGTITIGDEIIARIKHFKYVPKKFLVVDIEEIEEDGQTRYVWYGQYMGDP